MDTIAAISTSLGGGAISIVRISGDESFEIVNKIFKPKNKNMKLESHKLIYGNILDGKNIIDEVLISFMKSPKTYTKEDLVEINCHGSRIVTEKILTLLLKHGARQSLPGEFTKRAFVNGRIDLTQAESILDLISAKSEKDIDICLKNMDGFLRNRVRNLKQQILDSLSEINVASDYPEELEDKIDISYIDSLKDISMDLKDMIDSYSTGRKIKEGMKVAIVGKPNVGKSSIMNRLMKSDKSIVTDEAGTTRDILEDTFYINGYPIVVLDTAGIRESSNKVEKIGIELSKRAIDESDLVILVLDNSLKLNKEDIENIEIVKKKNFLIVFNKIDLNSEIDEDINKILTNSLEDRTITLSSLKDSNLIKLENKIFDLTYAKDIENRSKDIIISNIRHKDLFIKVKENLDNFLLKYQKVPLDISSIYLSNSLRYLGEIIGEISSEDMLDNIFANFCVGK